VVELRHDTIVRGVLADADEDMNLTMEGVTYEPLQVCRRSCAGMQPAQTLAAGRDSRLHAAVPASIWLLEIYLPHTSLRQS